MNKKLGLVVAILIAAIVGGYYFPQGGFSAASGPQFLQTASFLQGLAAGQRDQFTISNTGVVKVGTNGSSITEFKATTCNLVGTDGSQTATTSARYSCAVTGVASGDVVLAQLATTTNFAGGTLGWWISAAKASTTAGFVEVILVNGTGGNAVPSATNVGSSTNVWYMDN